MMKFSPLSRSTAFCTLLLSLFVFALTGCGTDVGAITTTVAPLANEDIDKPCGYDIVLDGTTGVQQGVLVMFERGDTNDLYKDPTFRSAVQALHYAIVWAHQCNTRSNGGIQADGAQGPARMLFVALSNLAQITGHPELATNGVVLYGFSAAGVLASTTANTHPDRLLGLIQYAAGAQYLDLDKVQISPAVATLPALIMANADDNASGTARSHRYFQRGRALGAPWAYAVQNDTGHCCNLSTRSMVIPWLQAIAASNASTSSKPVTGKQRAQSGTLSHFVCTPDGVSDPFGEANCSFTAASLGTAPVTTPQEDSGWLPDLATGNAWLNWVTSSTTN